MRSEEMFKRAVVRYSINGSIESITEEVRGILHRIAGFTLSRCCRHGGAQ